MLDGWAGMRSFFSRWAATGPGGAPPARMLSASPLSNWAHDRHCDLRALCWPARGRCILRADPVSPTHRELLPPELTSCARMYAASRLSKPVGMEGVKLVDKAAGDISATCRKKK